MDGLKVLKNCIACVYSFNYDYELIKHMHKSYYYSQFKMGKLLKVIIIATANVQIPTIFDFTFF